MTVSSTTNKHSYNGNGSQTAFAYTFKIFVAGDIQVYLNGVLKTINTHYTLSNVGLTGGGNVTFTSGSVPSAATGNVILLRSLALTQGVDLINYGAFDANIIESAYDKLTMMVQQLQEEVSRSIRFSATVYDGGTQEVSDTVANRAGKVLAYDAAGNISIAAELGDWKANWSTNKAFELRDLVLDAATNNVYICIVAHTSGTLSSDVSASKWSLVINATAVAASATTATTKASEAASSATAAANSASTSTTQANTSTAQASIATTKANIATTKAATATTKASEASTSASNAATSASTASTQATNSSNSASAGSTSATNSANSATAAASSASTATTKSNQASASASTASTQATNSANSATASANSATAAANSATAGANSATASANSATAGANSATNAASALSTFQGIFYGSLSSVPTSNVASGDLYFDSGTNAMKVYNGSAWQVVAPTVTTVDNSTWSGTDLAVANGGTGASSDSAARTNLGLVIGTHVLAPNGSAANLTNLPAGGAEDFVASGTLPNGKPVVLKSNGQVEVVGPTTASAGSAATFESANTFNHSATYDSTANKVVVFYRDNGNSNFGTSCVGTVSGTSISFGTPVVFNSGDSREIASCYDSSNSKVVVAFRDDGNSNFGAAIVGTVSGTGISFGSEVVFASATSSYIKATFNSITNKVIIAYQDSGNSNFGTAIVGTVSGTGISFGSEVVFESANSTNIAIGSDSSASKVVIAYSDEGNSAAATAVVGTLSGTGISFGTPVVFSTNSSQIGIAYASSANKFAIGYRHAADSSKGKAIVGTVSGTGISFGTPVVFSTSAIEMVVGTYSINANKVVFSYRDTSATSGRVIAGVVSGTSITFDSFIAYNNDINSNPTGNVVYDSSSDSQVVSYSNGSNNHGTANVIKIISTNLTSTDFLGTATAAYTNGQTASIMLKGGISDNQTSLTVGSTYYVQPNGTFATSAGTPSVLAGKAVSATSLLLNGLAPAPPVIPEEIPSQTGNTGKFLTTDGSAASWGTVAPAGVVLLASVTASATASVEFSNKFSSTYDYYFVIASGIKGDSSGRDFLARFEMNGTFTTDSTYIGRRDKGSLSAGSDDYRGYSNVANVVLGEGLDNNRTVDYKIQILGANNPNYMGQRMLSNGNNAGSGNRQDADFLYTGQATKATGIKFFPHAGSLYGRFNLYGVSK